MLPALLALGSLVDENSRFELVAPFPSIRWAKVQTDMSRVGLAQQMAGERSLQARIMWVDGTANIDACNSREKIRALMAKLKSIGFNTVVYDVKPIVGYTLYPSKLTDQLTSWKGQSMPRGFDPLAEMVTAAKDHGLVLFVAMNAFSEGHSYSKRDENLPNTQFGKPGWGYEHPELQTTQYVATPTVTPAFPDAPTWDVHPTKGEGKDATPVSIWGRTPPATAGGFFAAMTLDGTIAVASREPMAPAAGQVVAAFRQPAADYMATWASPGRKLRFNSRAQFLRIAEAQTQIPLMMNPHDPTNCERAAAFAHEVASNYAVDGVLFDDRLRFGGMNSDFSESTRLAFERAVGAKLNWPNDVFQFTYRADLTQGIRPGPYFDAWLTFRAKAMADSVMLFRESVKRARPEAQFGIYAGSWYGDYVRYGSNYASQQLEAGFPFLSEAYRKTGFALALDVLITGCYYPIGTVYEAMEAEHPVGRTVEAAGILSNRVARDSCWTYAGIMLADYFDDPARVATALQAAAATTQGVMVFDLSHQFDRFEPILRRAFKNPARAPHQWSGLIDDMRQRRRDLDRKGVLDPPFPLFEGAPGAGF